MLIYSIENMDHDGSTVEKTLHIEGEAVLDYRLKLHEVLRDALSTCDHLIVNIEKVRNFDCSFVTLICSVHLTALLLQKKLTIIGNGQDLFAAHTCGNILLPAQGTCVFSPAGGDLSRKTVRPVPQVRATADGKEGSGSGRIADTAAERIGTCGNQSD